jgi:hypothetical protein
MSAAVTIAKEWLLRALPLTEGIREEGSNRGPAVERMLRRVSAKAGDPWCAAYVNDCGKTMLAGEWKLPMTASCDVMLQFARTYGVLTDSPETGSVFLVMKNHDDAIHTGFVLGVSGALFDTIEGNTNTDGSSDGNGVYKRKRTFTPGRYKFINWWLL